MQSVTLDEYTVGNLRGGGGFGLVFEGESADKKRVVALKVLKPNSALKDVQEFEREGILLKALKKSSNVVDFIATGETSVGLSHPVSGIQVDIPIRFHVLELSSGSLDEIIDNLSELSWRERLNIWRAVVRGVHQMHLKNIVHRDLKSENCLLFLKSHGISDCKVADLGRSRDLGKPPTGQPLEYLAGRGDMRFAPPEFLLFQGDDTPAGHKQADLYGLGSLLFELTTGQAVTSFALGVEPNMVMGAAARMRANSTIDLAGLQGKYEDAFATFGAATPTPIRRKSIELIRQLCNPEPKNRLPRTGLGKRAPRLTGLEWLINQADIMIRQLDTDARVRGAKPRRGPS